MMVIPHGVYTFRSLFGSGVFSSKDGKTWRLNVPMKYPQTFTERVRSAWWVFTGRAEAFIWPKDGEVEQAIMMSVASFPRSDLLVDDCNH